MLVWFLVTVACLGLQKRENVYVEPASFLQWHVVCGGHQTNDFSSHENFSVRDVNDIKNFITPCRGSHQSIISKCLSYMEGSESV